MKNQEFVRVTFDPWPENVEPWQRAWTSAITGLSHSPYAIRKSEFPRDPEQLLLFHHEHEGHNSYLLKATPAKQLLFWLARPIYAQIIELARGELGNLTLEDWRGLPTVAAMQSHLGWIHRAIAPSEELMAIWLGLNSARDDVRVRDYVDEYEDLQLRAWFRNFRSFPEVRRLVPSSRSAGALYRKTGRLLDAIIRSGRVLRITDFIHSVRWVDDRIRATAGLPRLKQIMGTYRQRKVPILEVEHMLLSLGHRFFDVHDALERQPNRFTEQLQPAHFWQDRADDTNWESGTFSGLPCQYASLLVNWDNQDLVVLYFLESMRQQLMTGQGLRCPFWSPRRRRCVCAERPKLRSVLEGIWVHTVVQTTDWKIPPCLFPCL